MNADQRAFLTAVLARLVRGRTRADRQELADFIKDVGFGEKPADLEAMFAEYQRRFENADEAITSATALLLVAERKDMPAVAELGRRKLAKGV